MNATLFLDAALDALLDSLRMLPFLFVAFLILEALEHYSSNRLTHFFQHKKGGPAIASLLGCIPQCGFSTLISSLYCGGIVTVGTLIAVYLSTSDEAILILLAHPDRAGVVGKLLLAKLIIAIPAGYLVDFIWNRWRHPQILLYFFPRFCYNHAWADSELCSFYPDHAALPGRCDQFWFCRCRSVHRCRDWTCSLV